MRTNRLAAPLAAFALVAMSAPAAAQHHAAHGEMVMPSSGLRAELIQDIEQLERKYLSLAEAVPADKYAWRPAEGVRSVGEVFAHIAGANFMIPGMIGVQAEHAPAKFQSRDFEKTVTDKAELIEGMRLSFMHAKHAVAKTPEGELDATVKMFGRDASKRQVLSLLVTHMHEHLGQSIAYARTNGVVPPWSGGD